MANPALFEEGHHDPCELALEFIKLCQKYPITAVVARGVVVKMLLPLFVQLPHYIQVWTLLFKDHDILNDVQNHHHHHTEHKNTTI